MLILDEKMLLEEKIAGVRLSRSSLGESYKSDVRKSAYRFMLVVIAAKLAACDGLVNKYEIREFPEIFAAHLGSDAKFAQNFVKASNDAIDVEHYVARIRGFYPKNDKLFRHVIGLLLELAACDGVINSTEMTYIRMVTKDFGLPDSFFINALGKILIPRGKNAFEIMQVKKNVSREILKRMYYKKISDYHPDKLVIFAANDGIMMVANERVHVINNAYEAIKNYRKFT